MNSLYGSTAPVLGGGSYRASAFGVYDTVGNVYEWGNCEKCVLRGGFCYNAPRFLRSANRGNYNSRDRHHYLGFRIARMISC